MRQLQTDEEVVRQRDYVNWLFSLCQMLHVTRQR